MGLFMNPRLDKLAAMLEADPNDAFVLYGLAQEHAKVGTADEHERAVCYYDRCIAADPAYHYAYYHKAMSLIELERTEDAAATLRQGLASAKAARDHKASGELAALLDQIS
jgi:tetratricopeptide (TPR) repeat protein